MNIVNDRPATLYDNNNSDDQTAMQEGSAVGKKTAEGIPVPTESRRKPTAVNRACQPGTPPTLFSTLCWDVYMELRWPFWILWRDFSTWRVKYSIIGGVRVLLAALDSLHGICQRCASLGAVEQGSVEGMDEHFGGGDRDGPQGHKSTLSAGSQEGPGQSHNAICCHFAAGLLLDRQPQIQYVCSREQELLQGRAVTDALHVTAVVLHVERLWDGVATSSGALHASPTAASPPPRTSPHCSDSRAGTRPTGHTFRVWGEHQSCQFPGDVCGEVGTLGLCEGAHHPFFGGSGAGQRLTAQQLGHH
ncbi:hypothetical protein EYF80_007414 [Liparis tanakae]|uniref:Uncharacterized protein n=1 Tax=Liparis tanakae TaxID=230148 RepID=A0A4Z2IYH1_9TELE|nr:hypothetical protein EYF80_007414 [Liparis tanakae]